MDVKQEELHARIFDELGNSSLRKGVWAKALVDSGGDENKARSFYIKIRLAQEGVEGVGDASNRDSAFAAIDASAVRGHSTGFANTVHGRVDELPHGIVRDGGIFVYLGHRYERLEDAISYAEKFNNSQQSEPASPATAIASSPSDAGRLPRFFARQFDIVLFSTLLGLLVHYFLIKNNVVDASTASTSVFGGLVLVCVMPFVFYIDALTFAAFGNTIGKSILGIEVRKLDNSKLTYEDYFDRNITVWIFGYGFGVPVISFGTFWSQFDNVKNQGSAGYDLNKYRVLRSGNPYLQAFLYIAALIAALLVYGVALELARRGLQV